MHKSDAVDKVKHMLSSGVLKGISADVLELDDIVSEPDIEVQNSNYRSVILYEMKLKKLLSLLKEVLSITSASKLTKHNVKHIKEVVTQCTKEIQATLK
ncbi:hypothetical protein Fsol_00201 [Candidatus Fokinia solitaria]|uniref:Uncharacterized protein n=1 Tax=Candidatus Fokinia solitaria TaxID=1802984 RepID=A0A2U8BRN7_9RICK|nr:hypothetical protein [Candidatus Fokinia solitaria]AWD33005.1 hypothetical protein Fsol_00201 [Candidatus Fokinia solitaria]